MSECPFRADIDIRQNISAVSAHRPAQPANLPGYLAPPQDVHLFAILDAALLDWVPDKISGSGLPHACLFEPGPNGDLQAHAPWLVQLDPDGTLARNLMTAGDLPWTSWGQPGILFLHSRQSMPQLRRHFRRILYLPNETGGNRVFLRFWLADILHDLCRGADPDWTAPHRLFGAEHETPAVDRFLVAWDDGRSLLIAPAPEKIGPGRLIYDARLEETLRGTMRRRFADEMARHCASRFPRVDQIAPDARQTAFLQVMDQGRRLGLTQRGPLIVWAEASLLFGIHAIDDHAVRPILQSSVVGAQSQMQAAQQLHLGMQQHLQSCVGIPDRAILSRALDRIDPVLKQPTGSIAAALIHIWPQRVDAMGRPAFDALLDQIDTQLAPLGPISPVGRLAYAILCLFLGTGFQHDPFLTDDVTQLFSPTSRHSDTDVIDRLNQWASRYFDELGAIA